MTYRKIQQKANSWYYLKPMLRNMVGAKNLAITRYPYDKFIRTTDDYHEKLSHRSIICSRWYLVFGIITVFSIRRRNSFSQKAIGRSSAVMKLWTIGIAPSGQRGWMGFSESYFRLANTKTYRIFSKSSWLITPMVAHEMLRNSSSDGLEDGRCTSCNHGSARPSTRCLRLIDVPLICDSLWPLKRRTW